MSSNLIKLVIFVSLAFNIILTIGGLNPLLKSPYTGIRMTVCGDTGCVESVDKGSPAYGKIKPGDRLIDVGGPRGYLEVDARRPDVEPSAASEDNSCREERQAMRRDQHSGPSVEVRFMTPPAAGRIDVVDIALEEAYFGELRQFQEFVHDID